MTWPVENVGQAKITNKNASCPREIHLQNAELFIAMLEYAFTISA